MTPADRDGHDFEHRIGLDQKRLNVLQALLWLAQVSPYGGT